MTQQNQKPEHKYIEGTTFTLQICGKDTPLKIVKQLDSNGNWQFPMPTWWIASKEAKAA